MMMKSPERKLSIHEITKLLFTRLLAIYGTKWSINLSTPDAVSIALEEWGEALKNIPTVRIKMALVQCREPHSPYADYPPTLGQFVRLCVPNAQEMGIPSPEEAYYQAIKPSLPRHPIVQKAIDQIGAYSFRMMSEDDAYRRFISIYKQLHQRELRYAAEPVSSLLEFRGVPQDE